jgi:hypothetical protein
MNRLPAKYRAPLVLCYLEGKTNEEAARELGRPSGSMSKLLARGRDLLHERLCRRGVALSTVGLGTLLIQNAGAAVPPVAVVDSTAMVASAVASGPGTTASVASTAVSTLTEGVLRSMFLTKLKMIGLSMLALVAAAAGSSALLARPDRAQPPVRQQAAAEKTIKDDLTVDSFAKLHALIRPQDNEWRHLKVQWLTDVVAARKKAASEDKPILICYTGGAGYNEPLGVC